MELIHRSSRPNTLNPHLFTQYVWILWDWIQVTLNLCLSVYWKIQLYVCMLFIFNINRYISWLPSVQRKMYGTCLYVLQAWYPTQSTCSCWPSSPVSHSDISTPYMSCWAVYFPDSTDYYWLVISVTGLHGIFCLNSVMILIFIPQFCSTFAHVHI